MTESINGVKIGRPLKPEHLKEKPKTKVIRVPIESADTFKSLVTAVRSGLISIEDIEKVLSKMGQSKNEV